jgi:hypothetical protein
MTEENELREKAKALFGRDGMSYTKETLTYTTPIWWAEKIKQYLIANFIGVSSRNRPNSLGYTVFDMTGCIGGDTIPLSKYFKTVHSCELNPQTYELLVANVGKSGAKNIKTYNDDSDRLLFSSELAPAPDVVYMDPPWGGAGYDKEQNITLRFGSEGLTMAEYATKIMTIPGIRLVVLKLPHNHDISAFNSIKLPNVVFQMMRFKKILLICFAHNQLRL